MAAETKVVDASAVAALLFGEPRAAEVAFRLGSAVLVAPALVRFEIASVCSKKLALYPRRQRALLRALSLLDDLGLRELDVPLDEVILLARRERLTAYDATYLWLSRALGVELVTLDKKLARSAG